MIRNHFGTASMSKPLDSEVVELDGNILGSIGDVSDSHKFQKPVTKDMDFSGAKSKIKYFIGFFLDCLEVR